MKNLKITYFGILRAPTSWAKVSREMISALIDLGIDVNIYERKGFLYDSIFPLPKKMESCISQRFRDDIVFTFEHPTNYKYLNGKYKIGLLTYESTVIPPDWIENINNFLDILFVPSDFCRDIFVKCGVRKDKVFILPYGYNPHIFNPEAKAFDVRTRRGFRFLNVSLPHKREGLDLLLDAYTSEFSYSDDVSLIIKVNYLPQKRTKPFEYTGFESMIKSAISPKCTPETLLISRIFTEKEMAQLYSSCSCLISPTRGEGFGLTMLEAMACGLPVITTGWGGHLQFLNHKNASLIDYKMRRAKEIQYDCQDTKAMIAEPDIRDLKKKMRLVYKERPKGKNYDFLKDYTWKKIAKKFLDELWAIGCRP